jgi:hypothetical protein
MKTLKLSEASRSLAQCASELDEDIVLVTARNRPIGRVLEERRLWAAIREP